MLNFKEPTWALAELFGHSSYFGRVQEVMFCGAAGLAIEPLTVDGFLHEFFAAGSAVFRLTPMSEDDVRYAVLPRAYRACETFQASVALPSNCRGCGRDEQEHVEEQQRKALPPGSSVRAASVIPDALFEEGEGEDDIPFDHPRSEEFEEDNALTDALNLYLRENPRHATEALAVMLRSGHDKIELIRAPLASSAATDEPLGDRARKALEGTPVANADVLAATLRAPVGVVSAKLEEMGWTSDGHGLWMRPCDHGVVFDQEAAKAMSTEQIREQFPRLFGDCPKGCGYNGIAYASTAHFVYGDW